jgi:hypothetical protein
MGRGEKTVEQGPYGHTCIQNRMYTTRTYHHAARLPPCLCVFEENDWEPGGLAAPCLSVDNRNSVPLCMCVCVCLRDCVSKCVSGIVCDCVCVFE